MQQQSDSESLGFTNILFQQQPSQTIIKDPSRKKQKHLEKLEPHIARKHYFSSLESFCKGEIGFSDFIERVNFPKSYIKKVQTVTVEHKQVDLKQILKQFYKSLGNGNHASIDKNTAAANQAKNWVQKFKSKHGNANNEAQNVAVNHQSAQNDFQENNATNPDAVQSVKCKTTFDYATLFKTRMRYYVPQVLIKEYKLSQSVNKDPQYAKERSRYLNDSQNWFNNKVRQQNQHAEISGWIQSSPLTTPKDSKTYLFNKYESKNGYPIKISKVYQQSQKLQNQRSHDSVPEVNNDIKVDEFQKLKINVNLQRSASCSTILQKAGLSQQQSLDFGQNIFKLNRQLKRKVQSYDSLPDSIQNRTVSLYDCLYQKNRNIATAGVANLRFNIQRKDSLAEHQSDSLGLTESTRVHFNDVKEDLIVRQRQSQSEYQKDTYGIQRQQTKSVIRKVFSRGSVYS